jgi:hypothetical protein
LNHHRPNIDRQKEYGIAFGEAVLISSPPSRSQMDDRLESGFGGRADEKIQTAREVPPLLGRKKSYPQHLTIARYNKQTRKWRATIVVNRKRKQIGYFRDEIAAARAYDEAAKKHYKDFAILNFPRK